MLTSVRVARRYRSRHGIGPPFAADDLSRRPEFDLQPTRNISPVPPSFGLCKKSPRPLRYTSIRGRRSMQAIISINGLTKTYASGFQALQRTNLEIRRGEIFGLLGPNGAGKTTLINIVCGIVNATSGTVSVGGHDIRKDARAA